MKPSIKSIAVEDLDKVSEEYPKPSETLVESNDDIVEPVIEIKPKAKRVYKPRIKIDKVEQPSDIDSPTLEKNKMFNEIEVLKDPIVELDQNLDMEEFVRVKSKKKDVTVTCPNCDKEMLAKTYKYYHSLKCKTEEPVIQNKEVKEVLVSQSDTSKEVEEKVQSKEVTLDLPSTNRHIQRREFYKKLTNNAF